MNQLSLSQAMQLRSGRRLDPLPPPGCPRRPDAGAGGEGVGEEDRISSLPEDVLLDILSHLGCAREAARTSVLAKRWRGLRKRLPELTFDEDVPLLSMEGLLSQVTCPELNLLEIDAWWGGDVPANFSSVLRAAERLAPKHLIVCPFEMHGAVELPCFDRTTSLTLYLPEIDLTPPPAGEFTALQSLQLHVSWIELGSLLPMCPSLRSLCLNCWASSVLIVHSTTLEKLDVDCTDDEIREIDIITPQLKEASLSFGRGKDFSMSFSAPMLETIRWECTYEHQSVGLQNMRLHRLRYYLTSGVHTLDLDICYGDAFPNADRSFGEEIQQLPFSQFSVLVLYLGGIEGHTFGPLVLHLLQIRPVQKLKVNLRRQGKVSCPLDCPCNRHTNWRNKSISLTELEEVSIYGLEGEDDEAAF